MTLKQTSAADITDVIAQAKTKINVDLTVIEATCVVHRYNQLMVALVTTEAFTEWPYLFKAIRFVTDKRVTRPNVPKTTIAPPPDFGSYKDIIDKAKLWFGFKISLVEAKAIKEMYQDETVVEGDDPSQRLENVIYDGIEIIKQTK